jgi:hypothetical protein
MADFNQKLQGLLSNPLFNLGTGLLAASGPSTQPVGFGQALVGGMNYANQRQAEQMQLQQARNQLEMQQEAQAQARRQQDALAQFQGLLSPTQTPGPVVSTIPPAINTPEGQAMLPGLLAQIAPGDMAQQLIAQQFAQPETPRLSTGMNDFMAMNPQLTPGTPEFSEAYKQFAMDSDPNGTALERVQLELNLMQLQNQRAERERAEDTVAKERRGMYRDTVTDLKKLEEMADLNRKLEGSFLAAGMVSPDLRRDAASVKQSILQSMGQDTTEAQQAIADFDRFGKLIQDFVINSIDRFQGSGSMTQGKFDALLSANASLGVSPQANNLIFADNIDAILDSSEIEGIEIPNAEKLRELSATLRGGSSAPATGVNVLTAPLDQIDVNLLTPEQQRQLDQRLRQAGF